MVHAVEWQGTQVRLLNQTVLPQVVEYIDCTEYQRVAEAIKRLEVRGAPAIGVAAAFGMVLGARQSVAAENFWQAVTNIGGELKATRPTAVNLFWAIDRMLAVLTACQKEKQTIETTIQRLEAEAIHILEDDLAMNYQMAKHGATLFIEPTAILTHCNAGALATGGYGTALGVVREAHAAGHVTEVFADETRPLLQGARLTAWELMQDNIPVTLITDNMAGWVMQQGKVQAVIVGADRITCNGDVANKIGTYSVAVLAKRHNIPFYVAAPVSTFDFTMQTGADIPIEERHSGEITQVGGVQTAPAGVKVFNPAFDVTPNELVSAIITEHGVLRPPYDVSIQQLKARKDEQHD